MCVCVCVCMCVCVYVCVCVCVCVSGGGGLKLVLMDPNSRRLLLQWYKTFGLHEGFLTLKAPITTVADDIHKYCFIGRGFT